MVRISRLRMICVSPFLQIVGRDIQHLFLCEQVCNLRRAAPFQAEFKYVFDHFCGFLIHDPFLWIVRVFDVTKWNESRQ